MKRRDFIKTTAVGAGALAVANAGLASDSHDLVLNNINAFIDGAFKKCDICIAGGRIVDILDPGSISFAANSIDGDDLYVSPGWVDYHVHMVDKRHGKFSGVPISRVGAPMGVTAVVDAGTVGPDQFGMFEKSVSDNPRIKCFSMINIKRKGIRLTDYYTMTTGRENIEGVEKIIDRLPDTSQD